MSRINLLLVAMSSGVNPLRLKEELKHAPRDGSPLVVPCRDPRGVQLLTIDSAVLVAEQTSDTEAIIRIDLVAKEDS